MRSKVCVWIDSKNAFILFLGGEITQLQSDNTYSAPYRRRANDIKESRAGIVDHAALSVKNRFYDQVASQISHAESIYLFGPQTSKDELNYRLTLMKMATYEPNKFVEMS